MKVAVVEGFQSKSYRVLTIFDTSLTGDYKIRAKDGLEMFKTIHAILVTSNYS